VLQSFYTAYETNYADDFRAEIDSCVKSCSSDGSSAADCPLILSGNSVGGSIALVAALDPKLQQYNPTTITLGPHRSVVNEYCTDINTSSIYRIITANAGYYDRESDASQRIGTHVGHTIIADEMSQFAYVGFNDDKIRLPDNDNIHAIEVYLTRITNLANSDSFPITLTRFSDGHWCTENDECQSGSCEETVCTPAYGETPKNLPGAKCYSFTGAATCASGKCFMGRCTLLNGLSAMGNPCSTHDGCETQRCSNFFCLPKAYTGNACDEDVDCESNKCSRSSSWVLKKQCQP